LVLYTSLHSFSEIPAATVTETFNKVAHSLSPSGKSELAKPGTLLGDGEYLKTGKASLAEIELANQTITRLGPDTIFEYSAATHEADLQSGTILFSKPKDGKEWTIKMPGLTATVTGTTGFVEKEGNSIVFGVIEGTVHLTVGTSKAILQAGKMLAFIPGSSPQIVAFDIPSFVSTSAFFHRFQRQLPNEKYVEKEIARYNNLVSRGFIVPVQGPGAPADHQASGIGTQIAGQDGTANWFHAVNLSGSSVASSNGSSSGFGGGGTLSTGNIGGASGITISGVTLNLGSVTGGTLSVNAGPISAVTLSPGAGTLNLTGSNNISFGGSNPTSGTTTVTGGSH
jgi:hypothetical protein